MSFFFWVLEEADGIPVETRGVSKRWKEKSLMSGFVGKKKKKKEGEE